ncbi:MAG: phage baseplate assembly protein V [Methanogenium sp.]|jgi:hypothetical protein
MAELTSSQNISRNPRTSSNSIYTLIERVVINLLKRFRFLEIGVVENIDSENFMVRCRLLCRKDSDTQQGRLTKWLKVYTIFASNDEGICALPNRGDYGIIMFRNADQCGGMFFGMHFGAKKLVPNKNRGENEEKIRPRDILIKRNGSWLLIKGDFPEHFGDIELWHKDENFALITRGYEQFFVKDGLQFDMQRWSNQHSPPFEYKTADWIRTKNEYKANHQAYGFIYNLFIRRRKITIIPPKPDCENESVAINQANAAAVAVYNAGNTVVVADSSTNITSETDVSKGSTGIDELDPRVFKTHICDGKRRVDDDIIEKTLIQGDPERQHLLFKMHKHSYPKTASVGTDLTSMTIQSKEDESIHTYIDANMDFYHESHSVIKTYVDKDQSYILLFTQYRDQYQNFMVGTREGQNFIDTHGGKDVEKVEWKALYKSFAYELDEFDKLENTDDLVIDDQTERDITGIPQLGGEYTDDDVQKYWTNFWNNKNAVNDITIQDAKTAIQDWIKTGADQSHSEINQIVFETTSSEELEV